MNTLAGMQLYQNGFGSPIHKVLLYQNGFGSLILKVLLYKESSGEQGVNCF